LTTAALGLISSHEDDALLATSSGLADEEA
jgi:hypothetical protein